MKVAHISHITEDDMEITMKHDVTLSAAPTTLGSVAAETSQAKPIQEDVNFSTKKGYMELQSMAVRLHPDRHGC